MVNHHNISNILAQINSHEGVKQNWLMIDSWLKSLPIVIIKHEVLRTHFIKDWNVLVYQYFSSWKRNIYPNVFFRRTTVWRYLSDWLTCNLCSWQSCLKGLKVLLSYRSFFFTEFQSIYKLLFTSLPVFRELSHDPTLLPQLHSIQTHFNLI